MTTSDDLLALTGEQHGVLARRQASRILGPHGADNLLRSSRFERAHRGTYRLRGSAPGAIQEAIATSLSLGPNAVLTGPAALLLSGGPELGTDQRHLVAVHRRPRAKAPPVAAFVAARALHDTRAVGEVAVAAPVDALLDALRLEPAPDPRALRLAHDRMRWSGILRPGQLRERATQLGALPLAHTAGLLALDDTVATGDAERSLGGLLSRFDPPPEPQVWVTPHRCVDWFFRQVRLGIEYQGEVDHGHADGRARDRSRREELEQAGVRLLFVTAADLSTPRSLLTHIGSALMARAQLLEVDAPRFRAR